jgi:hypothetical protein
MAELGVYDFLWVRGTTAPLIVSFKIDDVPLPFDDVRLSVYKNKGKTLAFRMSLANDAGTGPGKVSIDSPGVIRFTPTAAQTRGLDETPNDGTEGKNRYEVELRNGPDEEVYLLGKIAAVGGINDDES